MKLSRKSIWRNLTEPAATVQDPEHRRRAQLLSTLLVPLVLATFLGTLSEGERQWSMFGALVVLSVTYGLSRTKYYIFAAAISVAALSAPSFVRAITDTDYSPETVASYLLWIALGVVLGGLVFSVRGIALTCAANIGGILLLPVLLPDLTFGAIVVPVSFVSTVSILTLLAGFHRERYLTQIAEKKLAIHTSEVNYRTLIESADAAISTVDQDGQFLFMNAIAARQLGGDPEDFIGKFMPDLFPQEIAQRQLGAVRSVIQSGHGMTVERESIVQGEPHWYNVNIQPIRDILRNISSALVVATDITALKQAETAVRELNETLEQRVVERTEALQESEARYRTLFEGINDSIFVHDEDGNILEANEAASHRLGYTHDELLQMKVTDINTPDFACGFKEGVTRQFDIGGFSDISTVHIAKDGRQIDFDVNTKVINYQGQRAILAVCRDITERKQVEKALQASNNQLRALIDTLPDRIIIFDEDGRYLSMYQGFRLDLKYQKDPINQLIHDMEEVPKHVADLVVKVVRQAIESNTLEVEEYCQTVRGKRYWNEARVKSLRKTVNGKRTALWVSRDITERKQAEEAISAYVQHQATLAKLGQLALAEIDISVLMDETVVLVAQTLGVEYCRILEHRPGNDALFLRAGVGWQDGLVGSALVSTGTESQAGYTLLAAEPVIVEDLRTESRFSAPTLLTDHGVVSGLSVIIAGQDGSFGILGAYTAKQRTFTGDEVRFVQSVATVLAQAIERKQTERAEYEQRTLAETLSETAALISSTLNLDEVLDRIINIIGRVVAHSGANIMFVDRNEQTGYVVRYCGCHAKHGLPEPSGVRISFSDRPHLQKMLEDGHPLIIPDVQDDPSWLSAPGAEWIRSYAGVPIRIGEVSVGLLNFDSDVQGAFTQEHVHRLQAFADQIAIAIHNARLYEELRSYTEQLEQRVAERTKALQQTTERVESILNYNSDAIVLVDLDGNILQSNPAFYTTFQYEIDEEFGQPVEILVAPDSVAPLRSAFHEAIIEKQPRWIEVITRRKGGTTFHTDLAISPITGSQAQAWGAICTLRDITARKRTEQVLAEKNQVLQQAQEAAIMGSWEWFTDTNLVQISEMTFRILGLEPRGETNEITLEEYFQRVHPDDQENVANITEQSRHGEDNYPYDTRIIRPDGTERIVHVQGTLVDDANRQARKRIGFIQDVTAQKQMEQALRESEERVELAVQVANVGIWDWDVQNDVLVWDSSMYRLYGIEEEDFSGAYEAWSHTLFSEDKDRAEAEVQLALRGKKDFNIEFRVRHPDGSLRHIRSIAEVYRDENGTPTRMLGVNWDNSEIRLAAQELEEAKAAAEAANRAKSVFLANMSHEIRTPLNAILGFTQLMDRDPAISPKQRENLGIIGRSGRHLLALINDILELSKIEAGRVTLTESDFDLHILLGTLNEMFGIRASRKGLQLTFNRTLDVPQYIKTDEQKLRQVLVNLLSNAVKFTEVGTVTLRVQHNTTEEGVHRLGFAVEDTGMGIALAEMDKVFDAFTQTASGRQAQEGTGLGLAISQYFVRLLGGELAVSSQVGQGTTFSFAIPVQLADSSDTGTEHSEQRVVGLELGQPTYRILVAEDDLESRVLLCSLLEQVGFEVRAAASGQEALEAHERWQPHLIWMDIRMPILDGLEATRQIKSTSEGQATVIIALTAGAFEEERASILAAGCDDYVRKPFEEREIFDKMAERLGVQFVYKDLSLATDASDTQARTELTAADLAGLPADWLAELHQAAIRADGRLVLGFIDQIRSDYAALAEELNKLVCSFRFDKLVALTDQGEHNE